MRFKVLNDLNFASNMIKFNVFTNEMYKKSKFDISYGFHETNFGKSLIGVTEKGICHLSFVDGDEDTALGLLKTEFPQSKLTNDTPGTKTIVKSIFEDRDEKETEFNLVLKGTEFQISVWQALTKIPEGDRKSYGDVANMIGNPNAIRSVASAVGSNKIAYLIPCHRVVPKSGGIGKYRSGIPRKEALLNYEARMKDVR